MKTNNEKSEFDWLNSEPIRVIYLSGSRVGKFFQKTKEKEMKTIELTDEEIKKLGNILLERMGYYRKLSNQAVSEAMRQIAINGYNICKSILEKL